MSSYFANSYMPDMRNGGVVSAEHPHQHQHYGAAVQVAQGGGGAVQTDPNSCGGDPSVVGLRQGIPPHHYGGPPAAGQPPQGMPYPRFPPYDRMDIRNAGYYGSQQQPMDGSQGYRPDSPTGGMHMAGNGAPNGHQTPVVYASCKLQAAAVGQAGVLGPTGSPPLDTAQGMNNHHMGHHMQEQHPQHHQQPHHQQQQHMMYGAQPAANMHPQPHQQPAIQQQQPPNQQAPNNTASSLPSPLYPWMRSQFGELRSFFLESLDHLPTLLCIYETAVRNWVS